MRTEFNHRAIAPLVLVDVINPADRRMYFPIGQNSEDLLEAVGLCRNERNGMTIRARLFAKLEDGEFVKAFYDAVLSSLRRKDSLPDQHDIMTLANLIIGPQMRKVGRSTPVVRSGVAAVPAAE